MANSQEIPNLPLGAARALGDNTAGIPACAMRKDSGTIPIHKGGSNWQAGKPVADDIDDVFDGPAGQLSTAAHHLSMKGV